MADDEQLARQIARGDTEAFDAFYREHAPRLQGFLRQIVRDPQAAEDLAQETFSQLWNRPLGFQAERGSLRAYLFGIGRNLAAEWWRRHKPADALDHDPPGAHATERDSLVQDAFSRLPEEQRTLLWLREVEGHSYAELALTLDVPVGTVRSRLFTAREALRSIWHRNHPHEITPVKGRSAP